MDAQTMILVGIMLAVVGVVILAASQFLLFRWYKGFMEE